MHSFLLRLYGIAYYLIVDLKGCLVGLARSLFGEKAEYRWVECYFPFTHPSWELEVSPLSPIPPGSSR
jgi:phenylalanyl-tRNA synthetase alpha subunit